MNYCQSCNKETKNTKFCSHPCRVKAQKSREKKKYYCCICKKVIRIGWSNNRAKYCNGCQSHNPNFVDWSKVTRIEFRKRFPNKYQYHARIRSLARTNKKLEPCVNCGYSKFVEVCHKKPIADFNDDTPISVINDKDNLVCLCPNCHWELDHGYLQIK